MATFNSAQYQNGQTPTPTDMCVAPQRAYYTFAASTTLAVGDVILLAKIAPTFGVHSAVIDTDGQASLAADAGIMNAANTAVSAKTHNTVSLGTAGIVVSNATAGVRAAITDDPRGFGLVITTGATVPAGFTIGVNLGLRPRQPVE